MIINTQIEDTRKQIVGVLVASQLPVAVMAMLMREMAMDMTNQANLIITQERKEADKPKEDPQ